MGLHFGISYLPGLSYLSCIKELIIMAITGFGVKVDRQSSLATLPCT